MPTASAQHTEDEEFTSFVDELSRNPDVEGLLLRLRHGHNCWPPLTVTTTAPFTVTT